MTPEFICHPDFADVEPRNVFHKEQDKMPIPPEEKRLCNRHILFRRSFSLPALPEKVILRITADDCYKLYLNGSFVNLGPAPSYPWAYRYNEYDVTARLRPGVNVIAVHTYYQGLINRVFVSGDGREMLWAELTDGDGRQILVSDGNWLCADHTGYTSDRVIGYDTAFSEIYDSRAAENDFASPDYDDRAWGHAAIRRRADYVLTRQTTSPLESETLLPVKTQTFSGGIRVDFGREAVGYPLISAHGNSGDEVTVRCGEELNDDGSVRFELRANTVYDERWILSGGEDVYRPFDYKAFRYMEILFPPTVTLTSVGFLARHYPFTKKKDYPTVPDALRPILDLCADTIRYGIQEQFLDCPTREKGQYLGDFSVSGRAHAILTGDATMMKKTILDFCETARICPGLLAVSTSSLMQEIADFSLQFPALVLWTYRFDGDIGFLRRVKPTVTAMLEYFKRYQRDDGLIENVTDKWNLVDWPKNLRDNYDFPLTKPIGPGVHNVLNAFWCGCLDAVDGIYEALGMPGTGLTSRTKASFVRVFDCPATGLFADAPGSEHTAVQSCVLPLLFDIGTEDPARTARLIAYIEERGLTSMGVYTSYFALAALVRHGRRDLAEKLALDPGCWLRMLREGATTTFEAWGKDEKWNTSLFHPWGTSPLIVFADGVEVY